jgi:hypothetical protein
VPAGPNHRAPQRAARLDGGAEVAGGQLDVGEQGAQAGAGEVAVVGDEVEVVALAGREHAVDVVGHGRGLAVALEVDVGGRVTGASGLDLDLDGAVVLAQVLGGPAA